MYTRKYADITSVPAVLHVNSRFTIHRTMKKTLAWNFKT